MKILLLHASAGAGHTKAAEAVYNALKGKPGLDVAIYDALDYTSPAWKEIYRKTYSILVTRFPKLWGFAFSLVDLVPLRGLVRFCRRVQNKINGRKLERLLIEGNYDYVLSTHFFSNEVLGFLKSRHLIQSYIIGIITDFDVHNIWVCPGIDHYCVASDYTQRKTVNLHVDAKDISITGIPTDQKFSQKRDRVKLRESLGMKDTFTVLLATGSFGIGPIESILKSLKDFQVVVICGHNKILYEKLKAQNLPGAVICSLVNNMHEWMAASDVMVTKPGGLSISEALVVGLPLIFFNAIPGQEENNVIALEKYGVGLSGCSIEEMVEEVKKFRAQPEYYLAAQKNIEKIAKPNAVADIVALIK